MDTIALKYNMNNFIECFDQAIEDTSYKYEIKN